MSETKEIDLKVSSGSNPPGLAPYFITSSIYDDVNMRRFETKDELKDVLINFENFKAVGGIEGIENVLKLVAERGFIIVKAKLSKETAKSLKWNF